MSNPPPKPGIGDMWSITIEDFSKYPFEQDPDKALGQAIIEDMKARRELGINRYGVVLQAFNGRDALLDAYEEALDLRVYLTQAYFEEDFNLPQHQDPRIYADSLLGILKYLIMRRNG